MTEQIQPTAQTSETGSIYLFNRGDVDEEAERLAHNHFTIWLPLTNNALLPPHILSHLESKEQPRVADVATGSGVWLISLAEIAPPRSELFGFDIDPLKFPPCPPTPPIPPPPSSPPLRPEQPKLDFRVHDVLKPFPEEFCGGFDLVHVRLLALGLKTAEWDVAVRNVAALLRPGGWVLWEDTADLLIRAYPPSKAYDEWWWANMRHGAKIGRDPFMPSGLAQKFQDVGLEKCEQKVWSSWAADKTTQDNGTAASLRLIKPSLGAIVRDGGAETIQTMDDVERIEREMIRDVKERGVQIGFDYFWVWGQRPKSV
ncbi:methyltransferase type 11 [Colletotrichum musicola]|uniref:Methyltransferase type 11 n=1 Tax=Colletotrichum musicola TaxID=2175873 RepID=A0A8H6N7F5_9PEZI|nr:methyltransferase type 11 [Colletotrichum musicola]